MKIYNIVLTLILFCAYNASFGQPIFPDDGVVFNDNIVSRVDITINPDTLEWLYDNVESYQEFHATFLFTTDGVIETVENIGFRLRGNTSRYSGKKSFKVSFNTFEPGRKWHGLEKMNLNGEHNDPSVSRSKICWDLLKDFGIAAPRSNHVELYINGNYHGLYLNVEHIDEEFVESRFGNKDGNLYKCLYPADLDFMGSNPELYKENLYGRRTYDLKTNTAYDDYSDLAHFIDVLNNTTPGNDFICEMEKVFNIYDYLKIIVIDIYTANWDGYIYNKNNFYLYHNTETGKFEYINYDMDNTLGIDWMGKDWATRDVYDWEQHGDNVRPLYTRIMANPELKDQYSVYFRQFLEQIIDSDINNRINALRDKIAPYIINDPFYPLDYGFSYSDFISSFEESFGAHVKYGIKPYLADRKTSALSQLSNPDMKPVIKYIKHGHPLPGEDLWVNAFIEDEDTNPEVKISYTLNGGALQNVLMYDDGNHEDGSQNDGFYGGVIYNVEMNSSIAFRVKAIDQFGQVSALPCDPIIIEFYPSEDPDLVINEFMASNLTTVADEFDEFDDWIEIFNKGTESVWLGDKFLSDNISNPDKWQFPDITLAPGDFVLIWADSDTDQGPLHTNFKLSASGEEIGIFDSESTAFFPLDTLSFGEQQTDISYGLITDGNTPWVFFNDPTPGSSNQWQSIKNNSGFNALLKLYPNPVHDGNVYLSEKRDYTIFNALGKRIYSGFDSNCFSTEGFDKGIYALVTKKGESLKFVVR